jgi:hypothetical protein
VYDRINELKRVPLGFVVVVVVVATTTTTIIDGVRTT